MYSVDCQGLMIFKEKYTAKKCGKSQKKIKINLVFEKMSVYL